MSIKKILSSLIFITLSAHSFADDEVNKTAFSIGLGIPYGVVGINISQDVTEDVELTAGIGVFGWAVGARYYPSTETPQFRLSGIYGTNTIVMVEECGFAGSSSNCTSEFKHYEGMNFGIGFGPRGNEGGWNADVILILTRGNFNSDRDDMESEGYEIDADEGAIKFSGGYSWRF